ncbi:Ig-like, group 2 [Candidatus Koribacter versatilis Ellin345]|uniref:Ig-like, group 2 n=1 Tax=Koribacter versatilis (strain Ellin345) TaxID=204669 RepID=Q1IPB5_KORVE|nr:Ig-like domain-containing protein [Candidatus Koribacter versatilis]ABF41285.1 Ig-like, group 2 [Candidatus Koribacter versatilis Ellin345]
MRSKANPGLAALVSVMLVVALSTSCSDFFPSSSSITAITISPTAGLVAPGATTNFTAQGTFGNNTTGDVTTKVTWSSSNASIATIVAGTGVASGVALGTAVITAKSDSTSSTVNLVVSNATQVNVTPSSANVIQGGFQQLTAKDQASNDITNTVGWSSSDTTMATVSSTGYVTVLSTATAGTVTITATLGTLTGTCTITII